MRRLDRGSVPAPACLVAPPPGRTFQQLSGAEKQQIRDALHAIQLERCAYCERRTGANPKDGHVEHFRSQAGHPPLNLAWNNLFWSCNDENSCGKFKDGCVRVGGHRGQFNPDHLIDPSLDDPDDFLLFVTDGTVQVKSGLDAAGENRARETLRVFNLADSAYLRKARCDAISPFVSVVQWLMEKAPDKVSDYVASEMAKSLDAPFSTAIRHFFRDFA